MFGPGRNTRAGILILALFLFPLLPRGASAEVVDRIVAVVGKEIILLSEIDEEVYLGQLREQVDLSDPASVQQYRADVLEGKIEEKILLEVARQQGIRPERAEVDQAVDRMVADISGRFPDEATFLSQLEEEGMSLEELRETYRPRVEEQLIVRSLMDRVVRSQVEVSDLEIQQYWDNNQDSIPPVPAALELRRILFSLRAEDGVDTGAVERAERVVRRLMAGEDFATLATIFSEGPAASRGGELGRFAPSDLDPRLAAAVEPLGVGEISEVVVTNRGAHILKVDDIGDDGRRALRQIVFLRDDEALRAAARARAESVVRRLKAGEPFEDLAEQHSDDDVTKSAGGYLGNVPVEALSPEFRSKLEPLQPGEISAIIEDAEGLSVFRVESKEGERPATFDEIRDRIAQILEAEKAQAAYLEFLDGVREDIYVENRLLTDG
ncbi:MAG: hypothetical protein HKN12_02125 [Gemmatimonadetes bacterium]|nr:hypothetical protein [Gemmatimonadota bacterium]